MAQKMNTLLAKVEHGTSRFSKMISDYCQFFKNKQGAFSGVKKTFVPRDGYAEDSRYISNIQVTTTVGEKLNWFEQQVIPYLKDVFTIEATNSKGAQKIELVVEGVSFGFLTALDLMRLKSILSKKEWDEMYIMIPVRSDAEVWEDCTNSEYEGREIFQTPMASGVTRTTETEEVILKDPNLDPQNLPANYNARTTIKKKTVETGDYTLQNFTGAWTQRQRAELLRRRSQILAAIVEALKEVNDVPAEQENLNVEGLINFLHYGK
jgi:hypothetical protein